MGDGPPAPDPAPELVARATEWIRRLQDADIDYAQLVDGFPLTDENARMGSVVLAPLGEPLRIAYLDQRTQPFDVTIHRFRVTFRSGNVAFEFGLSSAGMINQFGFKPLPGEPSPLHDVLPAPEAMREHMTPRPGETAEAMAQRALTEIVEAHRRRVDSAES
jgi:hypothetical protein